VLPEYIINEESDECSEDGSIYSENDESDESESDIKADTPKGYFQGNDYVY